MLIIAHAWSIDIEMVTVNPPQIAFCNSICVHRNNRDSFVFPANSFLDWREFAEL